MNIYVGNLNYRVEENEIKELFEEFGEVETCERKNILTSKGEES